MGWQWHQMDGMQINYTSLQTDNHASMALKLIALTEFIGGKQSWSRIFASLIINTYHVFFSVIVSLELIKLALNVCSRETFNALTNWLSDARTLASPNIIIILVGNKCDLDIEREVTFLEASRFAQENGQYTSRSHSFSPCIVTWWGGPGEIEAWSLGPVLPSVLWHCWLGHLTCKTRPQYDYSVFSGTLNPTQSVSHSLHVFCGSSSSSRDDYYLGGTIALLLQDHRTVSTTGSL